MISRNFTWGIRFISIIFLIVYQSSTTIFQHRNLNSCRIRIRVVLLPFFKTFPMCQFIIWDKENGISIPCYLILLCVIKIFFVAINICKMNVIKITKLNTNRMIFICQFIIRSNKVRCINSYEVNNFVSPSNNSLTSRICKIYYHYVTMQIV